MRRVRWHGGVGAVGDVPVVRARDLVDARRAREAESGLPQTLVMRTYAFGDGAGSRSPCARPCRVVYDLWEEVYRVQVQTESSRFATSPSDISEALSPRCLVVRSSASAPTATSRAVRGRRVYFAVLVELNPLSPDTVQRIRRWLARPSGGRMENERVLRLVRQPLRQPADRCRRANGSLPIAARERAVSAPAPETRRSAPTAQAVRQPARRVSSGRSSRRWRRSRSCRSSACCCSVSRRCSRRIGRRQRPGRAQLEQRPRALPELFVTLRDDAERTADAVALDGARRGARRGRHVGAERRPAEALSHYPHVARVVDALAPDGAEASVRRAERRATDSTAARSVYALARLRRVLRELRRRRPAVGRHRRDAGGAFRDYQRAGEVVEVYARLAGARRTSRGFTSRCSARFS